MFAELSRMGQASRLEMEEPFTAWERPHALTVSSRAALALWKARPGEILTVRDREGARSLRARLLADDGAVLPFEPLPPGLEPPAPRMVCQAIPDGERMLSVLQKGVELGATGFVPLITEKAYHGPTAPRQDKSGIWQEVARKAARQCRREIIPAVAAPAELTQLVKSWREQDEFSLVFLDHRIHSLAGLTLARTFHVRPTLVVVGPEGGLSAREIAFLREAGGVGGSLGARLLRTETAGLAFLALLAGLDGDGPDFTLASR